MAAKHRAAAARRAAARKPEPFDQIGAAAAARDRAVAVLDDRQAAGRREQRRAVDRFRLPGGIAAGADDVDRVERRPASAGLRASERIAAGKAAHFGCGHALGAQRRQQRAGHRRREFRLRSAAPAARPPRSRVRSRPLQQAVRGRGAESACASALQKIAHQHAGRRASARSPDGTAPPRSAGCDAARP